MSKRKEQLLTIGTLILVLAGASMPFVVSAVQEYSLTHEVETHPLQTAPLPLGQGAPALRALAILSGDTTGAELVWTGGQPEAVAAAQGAAALLAGEGLLPEFDWNQEPEIRNVFVTSAEESEKSALLWECTWQTATLDCNMTIDSTSGKLVQLNVSGMDVPGVKPEDFRDLADRWANFCADYYGVSASAQAETPMVNGGTMFPIELSDGEDFQCEILLAPLDRALRFNS